MDPARWKNEATMPSIWHYKQHLLRNLLFEPVHMLLVIIPYFTEFYQAQKKKFIEIKNALTAKMKAFIAVLKDERDEIHSPSADRTTKGKRASTATQVSFVEIAKKTLEQMDKLLEDGLDGERNDDDDLNMENEEDDEVGDPPAVEKGDGPYVHGWKIYTEPEFNSVVQLCEEFTRFGGRHHNIGFSYSELQGYVIRYARVLFFAHQLNHVFQTN